MLHNTTCQVHVHSTQCYRLCKCFKAVHTSTYKTMQYACMIFSFQTEQRAGKKHYEHQLKISQSTCIVPSVLLVRADIFKYLLYPLYHHHHLTENQVASLGTAENFLRV